MAVQEVVGVGTPQRLKVQPFVTLLFARWLVYLRGGLAAKGMLLL